MNCENSLDYPPLAPPQLKKDNAMTVDVASEEEAEVLDDERSSMPFRKIYSLSNRQQDALMNRGTPLQIAIPVPASITEANVRTWAAAQLPNVSTMLDSVEFGSVICQPCNTQGSVGVFGQIVDTWDESNVCYRVLVAILHLTPKRPSQPPGKVQWPSVSVVSDDGTRSKLRPWDDVE